MINAHTRQVVDMLPSRDQKKVAIWLKTFPNLKIVIRDGATFFRNAIKEAHPEAIQIADRFHVIQSLTRHAEKAIRSLLPKNAPAKPPKEVHLKKTISQKQKESLIKSVRELRARGLSLSKIGRSLHLDYRTVKRYVDSSINCLEDHQNRVYTRELEQYAQLLPELFLRHKKLEDIYTELSIKGYSRSFYTFQKGYKAALATLDTKEDKPAYIYRRPIIKLLFHTFKLEELDSQIQGIFQMIPDILKIINAVHQFKEILKTSNFSALELWLTKLQVLGNSNLNSFKRGFSRDKTAILNSMKFPQLSNGLAEGKINKLKVIKRIMFGRAHFDTLKKKMILGD